MEKQTNLVFFLHIHHSLFFLAMTSLLPFCGGRAVTQRKVIFFFSGSKNVNLFLFISLLVKPLKRTITPQTNY